MHMNFIKKNNFQNHLILQEIMEGSYEYFKDILEKMLMLDYVY